MATATASPTNLPSRNAGAGTQNVNTRSSHAKDRLNRFLSRDGRHDTTVHEVIKPAVEHEEVVPTERDELQTAVDREVHQDHYHTSVQLVKDRSVLPEEHSDRVADVEDRSYQHDDPERVKRRLEEEAAQFRNERRVSETQHTTTTDPNITGEHVHYHVHETIQPIVEKETIQPSVTHTAIPIHEVHHQESKYHRPTELPTLTMEEFKHQGGHLGGREEHTDSFDGEPRSIGGTLGGARAAGTSSMTEGDESRLRSTGKYESTKYAAGPSTTDASTAQSAAAPATTTGASNRQSTGNKAGDNVERSGKRSSSISKRHGLIDKLNPRKTSVDEKSLSAAEQSR